MGDLIADEQFPEGLDEVKIMEAVNEAFDNDDGLTAAFVVTWKGHVVVSVTPETSHPPHRLKVGRWVKASAPP